MVRGCVVVVLCGFAVWSGGLGVCVVDLCGDARILSCPGFVIWFVG